MKATQSGSDASKPAAIGARPESVTKKNEFPPPKVASTKIVVGSQIDTGPAPSETTPHFVIGRTLQVPDSVLVRLGSLLYAAEAEASASAHIAEAAAKTALEQYEKIAVVRKEFQAIEALPGYNVD